MKYIRTKDGEIINTKGLRFCQCSKQPNHYKDKNNLVIYVPIKHADTIEELCDEFVIINPDIYEKPTLCYGDYDEYKDELHKEDVLFGAIWTDRGLIYVAKMNEKGELELL